MSNTFDYIIVGAGSAGCVLAARLSEDPGVSVLLLEAGPPDHYGLIKMPVGFSKLMNDRSYNWCLEAEPEPNCADRSIPIPRGKTLGGSSSINGMIYVRGQPLDYNTWSQLGNLGWSYERILPYFMKSEKFERGEAEDRGQDGPLSVSDPRQQHPITNAWVEAGVNAGFPRNADYNNGEQEGFGFYQFTQRNGQRWSTARAYLDPARKRKNLRVETNALTDKLILDGTRAIGVEVSQNGIPQTFYAGKEVILAAGAVHSPVILERSGIGQAELLKSHGVEVVHELKGVGENYRDHYGPRMNYRVNQKITLNERTRGLGLVQSIAQYFLLNQGDLTLGAGLGHGFVKTRAELEGPDVQYHFLHASYATAADRRLDEEPGMTIATCPLRPESQGSIHLRSTDLRDDPVIRPNFLAAKEDQDSTVEGLKIARRISKTAPLADFVSHELTPGADVETDDEWLAFARETGQTFYHVCGTAKMGPDTDPMAVLDDRLRVHGMQGLRVIDASMMPTLVSGNTNGAVIMIAEKGADMIKEDAKV